MTLARQVQMGAAGAVGGVIWTNPDIGNASYDNVTLNTSLQEPSTNQNGPGIFFKPDGTKLYVIGDANKTVYQYTLSTAWDLSTASYASISFSVTSQNNQRIRPTLFFDPTGVHMYVLGFDINILGGSGVIYQYSLSTAWNVSTASYVRSFASNHLGSGASVSIFFKDNGYKLWIMEQTYDKIHSYTLSTAWDLSTASNDGVSVLIQPPYLVQSGYTFYEGSPAGTFFSPTGTKIYFAGSSGRRVYEYSLSTPFDITTATYPSSPIPSTTASFSVGTQENQPMASFFKPDGSKMYVAGSGQPSGNGAIYQYSV